VSVLQRKQLEDSPLADLHAIASELGLEGFRTMRREALIGAILRAQGAEEEPAAGEAETAAAEEEAAAGEAAGAAAEELAPDEVPSDEALEGPSGAAAAPAAEAEPTAAPPPAEEAAPEPVEEEPEPVEEEAEPVEEPEPVEEEPEAPPETVVAGVLDILANGSGFIRVDAAGQSRDDVYVAPAQIRRCELRAGDEVGGPVRPPRRNERHPSLVRVETVNGGDAEPPEERPWFGDLTPVFATARLAAPSALKAAPFGRGSRVAIVAPPGAGATALLAGIAEALQALDDVDVCVVLVGVRPEEVTEWRRREGLEVVGGSFDRSPDAQAQAAELAIERAKRLVERGGHAAVLVDSLDALPGGAQRRVFGAARATEEGGTLTVVATTAPGSEALRWATTWMVLEPGGKLARGESGTLHADRLS
jgi:transcription termination factor Rho